MNLFDITLHSLRRQKGKKLFLVAAMIVSLCAALVLFTVIENQARDLASQFDEYGANIVITPKTDDLSLSYGGINLSGIITNIQEIQSDQVREIYSIPNRQNIRAVSPKLIGIGPVRTATLERDVLLVGIDFEEEKKIKAWWEVTGSFPETENEALLGATAAEKMGLAVGDTLYIRDKPLRVAGVLNSTGSQDDAAVLLSITFVEELLGKRGSVSLVEVSALCSDCPIEAIVAQISDLMPNAEVRAIRQVMEQRMQIVRQFSRFAVLLFFVLTFLCGLFIFATMAGSVTERKKEIGVLRAIGFSKIHIFQVVLIEALLLAGAAGTVGTGISVLFMRLFLPMFSEIDRIFFDPSLIILCFAGLLFLAVASAIGPAVRASRFDPVAAITSL